MAVLLIINVFPVHEMNTISSFLRIIHPGQVVSYDYRPERLNVQIDMSEKITRFYCG